MYKKTLKRGRRGMRLEHELVQVEPVKQKITLKMALRHFCYLVRQRKFAIHLMTALMMPILVSPVILVRHGAKIPVQWACLESTTVSSKTCKFTISTLNSFCFYFLRKGVRIELHKGWVCLWPIEQLISTSKLRVRITKNKFNNFLKAIFRL